MKVYLFTNARDETNLPEWTAHHLLLGFQRIVIFDDHSEIPIKTTLDRFPSSHVTVLEITDRPKDNHIKTGCIARAIALSRADGVDWMLYLDADELLVLDIGIENVGKYINNILEKEPDCSQIGVTQLWFGSNGHDSQPSGLLLDNFQRASHDAIPYLKSLVKPDSVTDSGLVSHYYGASGKFIVDYGDSLQLILGSDLAEIINSVLSFTAILHIICAVNGSRLLPGSTILHFTNQSWETYQKRRGRPSDVGGSYILCEEKEAFHRQNNECLYPMYSLRYSIPIRNYLGKLGYNEYKTSYLAN